MRVIKLKKDQYMQQLPEWKTMYPVRAGNDLRKLNAWIRWAKKAYPGQKMVLLDEKAKSVGKDTTAQYWRMRFKAGYDSRYTVLGEN